MTKRKIVSENENFESKIEINDEDIKYIESILETLSNDESNSLYDQVYEILMGVEEHKEQEFIEKSIEQRKFSWNENELLAHKQAKNMLDKSLQNNSILFKKDTAYYYDHKKSSYLESLPKFQKHFQVFYNDHYKIGKSYRNDLLQVVEIDNNDPRNTLHSQDKVIAPNFIPKNTMLGVYTGIILNDDKKNNIDFEAEIHWLTECGKFNGVKDINTYSFELIIDPNTSLCLSAYNRGNMLMKINANTTYVENEPNSEANVLAYQMKYGNGIPFVTYWTMKDIHKGSEILLDYKKNYWNGLKNEKEIIHTNIKLTDTYAQVLKIDQPINDGPIRLYTSSEINNLEPYKKTEGEHNYYEFNLTGLNNNVDKFSVLDNWIEDLLGSVPIQLD